MKDHLQGELLRSLLKRLLILSTRMLKNQLPKADVANSQLETIRQYNLLVEQHFKDKHAVKDYADLLFKAPKTLSNLFKNYGDKSPLTVINDRILLEAKRQLLYSDKSIEMISQDLGYHEAGHFSKFFKKHTGLTPSNFRIERRS